MDKPPVHHSPNTIVSRILQVALGLFVTTSDLPPLPSNHELLPYDCSFDTDCRWTSVGGTIDRWRIARGEPDSFLWLAATGTMQLPKEPFALVEQRGETVDALMTDAIRCQRGYSDLSFTYWTIGQADLEICLTDLDGVKFNCTGLLKSPVMPGKVSLKIPELQKPFRIAISPNHSPGVLIVDDIRYDATICDVTPTRARGRPDFLTTIPPTKVPPWTPRRTTTTTTESPTMPTEEVVTEVYTTPPPETPPVTIYPTSILPTEEATVTEETATSEIPEEITTDTTDDPSATSTTEAPVTKIPTIINELRNSTIRPLPPTTTDIPFDLLIYGNKTKPLFDKRTGMITTESTKLLCDFNNEFSCQWGAEAGRWAIIEAGAIPSLENSVSDPNLLPTFPAALVLQGTAMLTSDPIRCQTGPGKLLFRFWSNGEIYLQVCALGYGMNSDLIECVDQSRATRHERNTLAVFELPKTIKEPFTLNIVPQWEEGLKNRFLVLDEIAYIGECATESTRGRPDRPDEETRPTRPPQPAPIVTIPVETSTTPPEPPTTSIRRMLTTEPRWTTTTERETTTTEEEETSSTSEEATEVTEEATTTEEETEEPETTTTAVKKVTVGSTRRPPAQTRRPIVVTIYPVTPNKQTSKNIYTKKRPWTIVVPAPTTYSPIFPEKAATTRANSITSKKTQFPNKWTLPPRISSITEPTKPSEDYCELLNCNFDDTACNYLNHGLTKKPWTLRNRGYGYPLTGNTDIRPTQTNGQFVSAILDPGDVAILESPRFNATRSLNVLLFQYYRPSHMTTIRLCLGSRYTNPMRTVSSFTQCPSILRSITSRNAFRWNTIHVQLPPGTTHFYLVAHNSERADSRASMAIDNMRVAICDPRGFAPDYMEETENFMEFNEDSEY